VRARGCAILLACLGTTLALGLVAGAATTVQAPSFAAATIYTASEGAGAVALGDLNGDGRPDVAVANSFDGEIQDAGSVSVRLNRGDGRLRPRRDYRTGSGPVAVALGDLNGDGRPDLVTGNGGTGEFLNTVSVLLNKGDGSFGAGHDYEVGFVPRSVAIGDLNGDGKADVVTANDDDHTVSVLLNAGDGTFEARRAYPVGARPAEASERPDSIAIADLNGDGKPDLVTDTSPPSVLLNRGDGSFETSDVPATSGDAVAAADLNGDGKLDLAIAHGGDYSAKISVLLNRGDSSFGSSRAYGIAGGDVSPIAVADLNGDGLPDLATATGRVAVLLNRGDGSFAPSLAYPAGAGAQAVALGDLNGDGRADLVSTTSIEAEIGSNNVYVRINKPGLCNVQDVRRMTLPAARETIALAHCAVGRVSSAYSKAVRKGRVISQAPGFGRVLPGGAKVNLVVSRGTRR
jgi:hypothetical protein